MVRHPSDVLLAVPVGHFFAGYGESMNIFAAD